MRTLALLALGISCAAQNSSPLLVNLGRLSIARVFASNRGGGPDGEGFYGVKNAFDGGSNILNGINYSSWDGEPGAFVMVRFSQPVSVSGIVVEGSGVSYKPSPEGFTVQIRSAGLPELFLSPNIGLVGPRAIYAPPRPVQGVREVMLTFQSKSGFSVEEIEILGTAPRGIDLTPATPARDPDLVGMISGQSQSNGPAQKALVRTLAARQIEQMRAARIAVNRATDSARKARAWFDLNRAADKLAEVLGNDRDLEPVAGQATTLGVSVTWCDPGTHWFAQAEGFEQYLQIFPNGPQADDVWWRRRSRDCGDFEGTPEEYEELIQWYSDFLKRFPESSSHAPEARQRLYDVQQQYKAVKPK